MTGELVKNKQIRDTNRGFTIAELVVVVGLIAILTLFIFGIMIANSRFYKNQSGEIRAVNSTREVADRLNELSRTATNFITSRTYSSTVYSAGSTVVIFQLPAVDSSGDIISGVFDHAIIAQDPGNTNRLIMIVDPDSTSDRKERTLEFSDNLTSVAFIYDDTDLALAKNVSYEITVTEPGANPAVEHVVGSATLRN